MTCTCGGTKQRARREVIDELEVVRTGFREDARGIDDCIDPAEMRLPDAGFDSLSKVKAQRRDDMASREQPRSQPGTDEAALTCQ